MPCSTHPQWLHDAADCPFCAKARVPDVLASPLDANAECRYCDEQAAHRVDCPWLLALVEEHAAYERSFELYSKASMTLMRYYKAAHPDVPENVWPDVARVNEWAVSELERFSTEYARLDAAYDTLRDHLAAEKRCDFLEHAEQQARIAAKDEELLKANEKVEALRQAATASSEENDHLRAENDALRALRHQAVKRALDATTTAPGDEPASITCPQCGWVSYNPNDVVQRYCGHCHAFHEDLPQR